MLNPAVRVTSRNVESPVYARYFPIDNVWAVGYDENNRFKVLYYDDDVPFTVKENQQKFN